MNHVDKQLLVAESLIDWIEIKMLELSTKEFSPDERISKYKKITSFLKGYRARDEKLTSILLQEEWQEMRKTAFTSKEALH